MPERSDDKLGFPAKVVRVALGLVMPRNQVPSVLLTRRRSDQVLAGYWEFPGGKVEKGESIHDAVCRELKEEVGLSVRPVKDLPTVRHDYEHAAVELYPVLCRAVAGQPSAIEVASWEWVSIDQLATYQLPEANAPIVRALQNVSGINDLDAG